MADATAGKVPVIACFRSAWRFLFQNLRLLLPSAAICALLSQIGALASMFTAPAGQAAATSLPMLVPAVIAGLMFAAAVLRKSVRDEFAPPLGLSLGADEGRLFLLGLAVALLAIPVAFLLSILILGPLLGRIAATPEAMEALAQDPEAMAQALDKVLGSGGLALIEIVILFFWCLLAGLIAFMQAATIGEKRVMVFRALGWTAGNVLRVLAAILLTIAPTILATIVMAALAGFLIADATSYLIVTTLIAFLGNILAVPVCALGAILYKGLRPPDR